MARRRKKSPGCLYTLFMWPFELTISLMIWIFKLLLYLMWYSILFCFYIVWYVLVGMFNITVSIIFHKKLVLMRLVIVEKNMKLRAAKS